MKILYVILLILVLYFVFYFGRLKYILYTAHLDVIQQKDQTLGTGPVLKYIAAGDSTAVGEGASSAQKSYTYGVAEYFSNSNTVQYKNIAVVGAKTQDVLDKQISNIISFDPDVITVSIGANDTTHFITNSKIIANYKKIIQQLTEKTKATIYITDVPRFDFAYLFPWIFREYFDSRAKAANQELLKLETNRVKIVDIHSVDVNNSRDQFHPSDIGYGYWTQAFLSKIKIDYP